MRATLDSTLHPQSQSFPQVNWEMTINNNNFYKKQHKNKQMKWVHTHQMVVRNLSISAMTKGERKVGLAGERGERERGCRERRADLWMKEITIRTP